MIEKEMPRTFFKFVTAGGGLKMLEARTVGYRLASDLNDVFELLPAVTHLTSSAQNQNVNQSAATESDVAFSLERFNRLEVYREQVRAYADGHAILSMSATTDTSPAIDCDLGHPGDPRRNLLLWAYYADGSKGIALEFDRSLFLEQPQPVEYSSTRPTLTLEELDSDLDLPYQHKSLEWSHETEWRSRLKITSDMKTIPGLATTYPIDFEPESLVSITVGCRADASTLQEVRKLLSDKSFRHVRMYIATMKKDCYSLVFSSELPTFDEAGSENRRWTNHPDLGPETIVIQKREI